VEVYFSFILLLALCPIEDLHVKLQSSTVIVELQEPPLMQIIILCEAGPASLEEHLAIAIIVYLHLIWRSLTRLFLKDAFAKLLPIHKLGKL
jgi:hypothetical protein